MEKKLFVGNLPYEATEDQLKEAFSAHGTVESVRIITDKFSGRSKGFAFIEMSSEDEAQACIDKLNNSDFSGRSIIVNEARPMEPRNNRDNNRR